MIGQGKNTAWKELGFQEAISALLKNAKHAISRFGGGASVHIVDANAGSSLNEYGNGSTRIIWNLLVCPVDGVGDIDVNFISVEKNRNTYADLVKNVEDTRIKTLNCDSSIVVEALPEIICENFFENPLHAVGFVLIDPNGLIDKKMLRALSVLGALCPRIDVVLNVNVSALKRCKGVKSIPCFDWFKSLNIENLQKVTGKKNCWIRDVTKETKTHWTIAVFTNCSPKRSIMNSAGFHKTTTNKGALSRLKVDKDKPVQMEIPWKA